MEVKLLALEGNYDRQTNRPTDGRTDGLIGRFHFQGFISKSIFLFACGGGGIPVSGIILCTHKKRRGWRVKGVLPPPEL